MTVHKPMMALMQASDPFPLERCSGRLRSAILAEFQGRCPALQEVFSIPAKEWLTVPGMGQTLLMELEAVMKGRQAKMKDHVSARLTEAQLLDRLERLQRELNRVRHDFLVLMNERRRRDGRDASPDGSDLH
ncbi:hypothetical protein [Microvirga vignae]|uniref:hypothetical protein n=1 Tax=Microvirga vignae TaxID=1225564 RepID=UPI001AEBDDE1|nr:hypothetical protein [Microvirga vignae]